MIEVEVLFFARARELAGKTTERLSLPDGTTVAGAASRLTGDFPMLGAMLKSCRFAVNEEFVEEAAVIPHRAVVAVIPPVSGG